MVATLHEIMQKNSIYVPVMARIGEIQQMTALEKLFTVELPEGISLDHTPGQFVEVSVFGVGEAPISISSSPSRSNGNFEMCVRSVGDVTRALHTLENGACRHSHNLQIFFFNAVFHVTAVLLEKKQKRAQSPFPWIKQILTY